MAPDLERVIYWAALVPFSICGTVLNLLLIMLWCTKRYKFNRLLLSMNAAFAIFYLDFYHVSLIVRDQCALVRRVVDIVLATVHMCLTMQLTFLAAIQYLFIANLLYYHLQPKLVKKPLVVTGIVFVGLVCLIFACVEMVIPNKTNHCGRDSWHILVASFRMTEHYIPMMLQTYLIMQMAMKIRCHQRMLKTKMLEKVIAYIHIDKLVIEGGDVATIMSKMKVVIAQYAAELSDMQDASFKERDHTEFLDPCTYIKLKNNLIMELRFTKAIIVFCFAHVIIYTIGFTVEILLRNTSHEDLKQFNVVFNVFKFAEASYKPILLIVMLPSLRQILMKKACCLYYRKTEVGPCPGKASETENSTEIPSISGVSSIAKSSSNPQSRASDSDSVSSV